MDKFLSVERTLPPSGISRPPVKYFPKERPRNKPNDEFCTFCGKDCVSKSRRIVHERIHTGEKPYECNICGFRTAQESSLKQHMETHSDKPKDPTKGIKCSYCEVRCENQSRLTIHERIHTGEKPYHCHLCDYRTAQSGSLKQHIHNHSGEKPFECSLCDARFGLNSTLKTHVKTVHCEDKPFVCHLCDFRCKMKQGLESHMGSHEGKFKCSVCNKGYATKESLLGHMKLHDETGQTYECKDCSEQFTDRVLFMDHRKTQHQIYEDNECDICGEQFNILSEFLAHKRKHKRLMDCESMECEVCGEKNFSSRTAFYEHCIDHRRVEKAAENEIDWHCIYCDEQRFEHGGPLARHINEQHPTMVKLENFQKSFRCPICEKFYELSWSQFLGHYRSHNGEMPYECTDCIKKFRTKSALAMHIVNKHSESHVTCKYCDLTFSSVATRRKHEESHLDTEGNVNFDCSECPEKLQNKIDYVAHYMVHYNARPFPCNLCEKKFSSVAKLGVHTSVQHKKGFQCKWCGETEFTDETSFKEHCAAHKTNEKSNLKCVYCNTDFERHSTLLNHITLSHPTMFNIVDKQKHFTCPVCNKILKRGWSLFLDHYRLHQVELQQEVHKCSNCNFNCGSLAQLETHNRIHTGTEIFKCKLCKFESENKDDFDEHMEKHDEEQPLVCNICDFRTKFTTTMRNHKESHKGKFRCPHCNKNYCSQSSLNDHLPKHENKTGKVFNCKDCPEVFKDSQLYRDHRKTHKKMANKECEMCGEQFTEYFKYNNHRTKHAKNPEELIIGCDQCPKRFTKEEMLQKHLKTHSQDLAFSCKHCLKKFVTAIQLRRHLTIHSATFKCKHCEVPFVHTRDRQKHEKKHLDSEGNVHFKCHECPVELKNGPDYASHWHEHYNQLPFGCTLCDRRFAIKGSLLNHCWSAHQGFKGKNENQNLDNAQKEPKKKNEPMNNEKDPNWSVIGASDNNSDAHMYLADNEERDKENQSQITEKSDKHQKIKNASTWSVIGQSDNNSEADMNFIDEEDWEKENQKSNSAPIIIAVETYRSPVKSLEPHTNLIEYSTMPLAVCVYQRSLSHKDEIKLIWLKRAEPDVVTAAIMNQSKCFIISQEKLNRRKYRFPNMKTIEFYVESFYGYVDQWRMHYFGQFENNDKLKAKHFKSYSEVEEIMLTSSSSKKLVNIIRYSDTGKPAMDQFRCNILECNSKSE